MLGYAKLIREYRERKFLAQTQLAEQIDVYLVTIYRWETRRFESNMTMKKKLAGLFKETGMKVDD